MVSNMNYRQVNNRNSMPSVQPPAHNVPSNCSCEELMRAIMEADFFALDLKLYLNTHPYDTKAIEMYREAVRQCKACKAAFEDSFYPLTAASAGEDGVWDWTDGNFPPLS